MRSLNEMRRYGEDGREKGDEKVVGDENNKGGWGRDNIKSGGGH